MFLSNEIIGKGMSNIYYWEKLAFSKLGRKVNFCERKFEKCTSFEVSATEFLNKKMLHTLKKMFHKMPLFSLEAYQNLYVKY